ncbi:MAG TPA: 3-hydroxyacyl-ACP dehydratase FabZ [Rudaea sp.]|jgi:3-hydroxyacyl-[acyl-carrier-protein] dehydratase|uniref:3-hydroxyacyl-ACP dehydratase FabZ n=1 Tax=Rudaea sp. TaxID=2136325 RepID=UPI002F936D9B
MTKQAPTLPIEAHTIATMLPHRYPFLLVDRVIEYEIGKRVRALKNVSVNEPFFQGHFPNYPVMPGVLIIEALAQASGVLVHLSNDYAPDAHPLYFLVKVDKAKFSKIVLPGDQLVLDVELKRMIRNMAIFHGRASVAGQPVAEAEIMCAESAAG